MDSVLQAGEGNPCAQGGPGCLPWEQLTLPAHICCPSAPRLVPTLRKRRFSFGCEPHLLRVAVGKYAFPETGSCPEWPFLPSQRGLFSAWSMSGSFLTASQVLCKCEITLQEQLLTGQTSLLPPLLDSCSYLQGLYLQSSATWGLSHVEWNMHWQVLHKKQRTNKFGEEPVWAQSGAGLTRPSCTSSGQEVAPDAEFWKRTARF